MNYRLPFAVAALVVCAGSATLWRWQHSKHQQPSRASKAQNAAAAKKLLSQVPVWFEALPDGRFASKSMGRTVVLDNQSAVWKMHGAQIRMKLANANQSPVKHGVDRLTARFDRFKGKDPSKWQHDVPAYHKVAYDSVYPGVDLVFYGKGANLEHDFIVAPKADPKQIKLAFQGASKIQLDEHGSLNLEAGAERVSMMKPVAYQTRSNGERAEVAVRFTSAPDQSVGFEVGAYDASLPLVIDPVIQYSSYYGASGEDEFVAVAVDPGTDSVWVAGSTDSADLTTNGDTLNGSNAAGDRDILVAQFVGASSGQLTILYSSVVGGTGPEEATAIGIAPSGNVYIVGATGSVDFPTVNPFNDTFQGLSDAFIIGIDPTQSGASQLVYSTFLGGTATDQATAMTIDANSLVYVAGFTTSTDFPTSSGAILAGNRGGDDPWVVKMDPTAGSNGMIYSTTYGGSKTDEATAVAVDSNGIIYLTGWTFSNDFPQSGNVPFPAYNNAADGFLVAINPFKTGNDGIVFCTYFGGSSYDQPTAMQIAPNGNLYIAGFTYSTDFPNVGNSPQKRNAGSADMFLMAWDLTQTPSNWIVFSTFLGSTGDDIVNGMSIDKNGVASLVGYTHPLSAVANPTARAFPTTANAVQPVNQGLEEAVIARINPALPAEQSLVFSTFWGGPLNDVGNGIVVDPRGCFVYAVGSTNSPGLLTVPYALQNNLAIGPDAFIINIDTCSNPQ